ncbi:ubiquitin-conjugating enzyme E2 T [Esox lucius]|uniref:Ubiquitin-conjugating enzyme E2 T n=1 Tax=Esox lucius TaxID=8010 RepID=C1BZC6_ESOLU|nr:ubiquitin-conjugating enzyme E2 T [Esox lucius]ACO14379.1 Ubiquitin-conjugating enzyme E2 T [Esox lucius]
MRRENQNIVLHAIHKRVTHLTNYSFALCTISLSAVREAKNDILYCPERDRMQRTSRLKRELQMLSTEPPPGITCWQTEEQMDELRAQIVGGDGTPFEGGLFSLEIKVPERYPFEPPKMRFLTPIYHPNIDNAGRICHDALKLPPKGAWRPSLNISTVLTSIQLLMANPNPDDPLMADISAEFKYSKPVYLEKAKRWTEMHAVQNNKGGVETVDSVESRVQVDSVEAPVQPLARKREAQNVCQDKAEGEREPRSKRSCL